MYKLILITLCLFTILSLAKEKITVFHAGSLAIPFSEMEKEFEKLFPQYDVQREASGSRVAARKISEIGKAADVMASADYKVIDNLLIPNDAKFNIQFATNEMVIAYTLKSKYTNEINENNWPMIFLKDGVKIGHSNPNMDPCGYRSMLVIKLAENFYKVDDFYNKLLGYGDSYKVGEENKNKVVVRPKETDLLGLLEVNLYDYLFIYKSVARQHGLKYITLPKQISLKDNEFKDFYNTVSFKIDGKTPGTYNIKKGVAMVYGVTIAQNKISPKNKDGAIKFVKFILSNKGQEIMTRNGQGVISPAKYTGNASILGR
jgi:molybdate/tungstate transport system substrate-binding protein